MKKRTILAAIVILGLSMGIPAWANHNDSTIVGLRVTVGTVSPTGDVTITVTASDDASQGNTTGELLSNAYLGTVFGYNVGSTGGSYTLITPKIPAIDWGDGATLGNAKVPFTTIVAGTHNGNEVARYKGQFSHTYGAPGVYTIKAFGINVYGGGASPIYGNEVTAATWSAHSPGSGTFSFSETSPDGVSATAAVTVAGVPALHRTGLIALAALLALTGAALLLLKRS